MKVAITGDCHFGVKGKTDDILFSLKVIREHCREHNIEVVLLLGDLFDDRRGTGWDVLGRAYAFFEETKEKYGQEWVVFPGNHDMFLKNSWEFHSLKTLQGVITVFDDVSLIKIGGQRFRIIPFVHYEDVFMQVVRACLASKESAKDDIILTHVGVKNASLNECFLLKFWSVVSFEDIPHKVYTGHFHCHQQVGDNLWYPGSPIAFNFAEGLVDHGFLVYDTEAMSHEFISLEDAPEDREMYPDSGRPPKFVTITDDELEKLDKIDLAGNNIRIAINRDYGKAEISDVRNALQNMGAKNVTTMRLKEKEVVLTDEERSGLSVGKPEELLRVWVEKDEPEGISKDLLFRLNKKVVAEGNERLLADMRNR